MCTVLEKKKTNMMQDKGHNSNTNAETDLPLKYVTLACLGTCANQSQKLQNVSCLFLFLIFFNIQKLQNVRRLFLFLIF